MSDIVERLRSARTDNQTDDDCYEAADEIERLRDESAKWKGLADANARVAEACQRRSEKLRDDLEASQAREAQLRDIVARIQNRCAGEALPRWENTVATGQSRTWILDHTNFALDIPVDDTALKARLKAERERCATEADAWGFGSDAATAIRNLGDE